MFRNFFNWNDSEYYYGAGYYGDPERDQPAVDTAASQVIRHPFSYASSGPTNPAIMVDRRDPPPVKQVPPPTPRVVVPPPQPRVVVTPEPRIDRNMAPPPPMMKVQLPPALEYRIMDFWVPLCCEGCPERIEKKLKHVRGVESVNCDLNMKKVIVRGYANPNEVLAALHKMFKRATFWPTIMKPVVVPKGGPGGPMKVVNVMEPAKIPPGQSPHSVPPGQNPNAPRKGP